MKVYTGTGDKGTTSLFSGERIEKDDKRIDAYGNIDELNSIIGGLIASLSQSNIALLDELHMIQSELLHIGAWLATTPGSPATKHLKIITSEPGKVLEEAIDKMDKELPPLKGFILPGGHQSAAWAHIARTVCRRAERSVISVTQGQVGKDQSFASLKDGLIFLNRLSDYLFVLARYCNKIPKIEDTIW